MRKLLLLISLAMAYVVVRAANPEVVTFYWNQDTNFPPNSLIGISEYRMYSQTNLTVPWSNWWIFAMVAPQQTNLTVTLGPTNLFFKVVSAYTNSNPTNFVFSESDPSNAVQVQVGQGGRMGIRKGQ